MNRLALLFLSAAAAAATVACGPDYSRTDITAQVASVPANEIDKNHITVAQGSVLKVHIGSVNTDGKGMGNTITSGNPDVMDVTLAITDHDYIFTGNNVGKTTMTIQADEDVVLILDAFVVPQPAPAP